MKSNSQKTKQWVERNKKVCPVCGNFMYYRSKTCKDCAINYDKSEKIKNMTVGEYKTKIKERGVHPSWFGAEIRNFGRSWNKGKLSNSCQNCGYDKHVELCHIRAISSFADSATLREVNSVENIAVLCPNCHWEFDNDLLDIKTSKI